MNNNNYLLTAYFLLILFSAISYSHPVLAEGPYCSEMDRYSCDYTDCCYWNEANYRCESLARGETRIGSWEDYGYGYCTGEIGCGWNEVIVYECDGQTAYCGYIRETCAEGQECYDGQCQDIHCGNNVLETNFYEDCDGSDFGENSCSDYYDYDLSKYFSSGTLSCTEYCAVELDNCNHCGDGQVDAPEVCDTSSPRACILDGYTGEESCNADCSGWTECISLESCGDGVCNGLETSETCFSDCIDGWHTSSEGFSITETGELAFEGESGIIISEGMDLLADKTYEFSAIISGNVVISIDSFCISNTTFTKIDCEIGRGLYFDSRNTLPITFSIPKSHHSINGVYYRNVTLRMIFTGTASISDISLRETDSPAYYDYVNSGFASGCCPESYCWDGSMCVDSALWMNDPLYPPIWNHIFESNWSQGHVNTSDAYRAVGYRCVHNGSRIAEWSVSNIKYDWNFIESGYCARDSDCFVSNTPGDSSVNSAGCVPTGTLIGNNYCHSGNWTTKSYIIATLFQNLSNNAPYTLHCYDNLSMFANVNPDDRILTGCVLNRLGRTQILVGLVLKDEVPPSEFLYDLRARYNVQYSEDYAEIRYLGNPADGVDCTFQQFNKIGSSNFTECISSQNNDFNVYYETNYRFFVVSNERVVGIERATIWDRIKMFFQVIFTRSNLDIDVYDSINHTTSYDRVFILRDRRANVTAIEDYRYDELLQKPMNVLFVTYDGSLDANNPLPANRLFTDINKTNYKDENSIINVNYTEDTTENRQVLILQTDNRTGLTKFWNYFTSSTRTRIPGGIN
jgi:hypothetical protein